MVEAPMFPNFKPMNLRANYYSLNFQKNHDESLLFPLQEDFFSFPLRQLKRELSRKKGEHVGP